MGKKKLDKDSVLALLNEILEMELAGVVRYTHYSFMVYGHARIPIISWLRGQADESMLHAHQAGEMITNLGGHPSLAIGQLLESENHDIDDILKEALEHEYDVLERYKKLLSMVVDRSVMLEEYARKLISEEEFHAGEVDKMLRKPGELDTYASA